MKCRLLLLLVLLPVLARPAVAGIIFGKKGKKPAPNEHVSQLLSTLRGDGDEHKRAQAAEELRQYDPTTYPDLVPALLEVLLNDKKPAVRAEAAQTLGKLRPVSPQVGQALEQALAKDPSMRVRLQARSSLLQYHWAGYRGLKKEDSPVIQSKEPPLAGEQAVPPAVSTTTPPPAPRLTPQPASEPLPQFRPAGTNVVPPTPRTRDQSQPTPEPPLAPDQDGPELTPPTE